MHYATLLAEKGNKVYFVNPPRNRSGKWVQPEKSDTLPNLRVIHLKPIPNALFFRHKLLLVYNLLTGRYISGINKIVNGRVDEVWNFNPNTFTDVQKFNGAKNILFLYDFYKGRHVDKAVAAADGIVSPSRVILNYYQPVNSAALLVQHGLAQHFAVIATTKLQQNEFFETSGGKIRIGYMGNLLREGMDTDAAHKIITAHPDKEFHFWGPYSVTENNVTDQTVLSQELSDFIFFLEQCPHAFLHGIKAQAELAREIQEMDAFLFLYTPSKDMNAASNSHKLLEYLSTGKTVISSVVSNYEGTGLLAMYDKGGDLAVLFNEVTDNLTEYNSAENQKKRILFALNNTYAKQADRIMAFIYSKQETRYSI